MTGLRLDLRARIADNAESDTKAGRLQGPEVAKRADIEIALRRLAPGIPAHELGAVVDHALDSPGLKVASAETAAWLSLIAYVRHVLTDYDELLREGYDPDSARFFVADEIAAVLGAWGVRRKLGAYE
jgi:hypothetical protein